VNQERGSVSLVLAAAVLVVLILTLGVADLGKTLTARSRARSAADAAALAAAQELAFPSGLDPAALADEYARANGAELITCACAVGGSEAVVEVRVQVGDLLLVPGAPSVGGKARALVDLPGGSSP
jgi:secretion/DNA translocation related TadE-like protein